MKQQEVITIFTSIPDEVKEEAPGCKYLSGTRQVF